MALREQQIAVYAYQAGFRGQDLIKAIAIAMAESGGNPIAHNTKPPDNSYGLWQINMLGDLGPARRKQFGLSSNSQLFDPFTNARAAYSIYRQAGRTFKDWTTYGGSRYSSYLAPSAKAAAAVDQSLRNGVSISELVKIASAGLGSVGGNSVLDSVAGGVGDVLGAAGNVVKPLTSIGDLVGFLTSSKNWLRVAMFLGGGVLLILGLTSILSQSQTVKSVASTAKKAAAVGALAA